MKFTVESLETKKHIKQFDQEKEAKAYQDRIDPFGIFTQIVERRAI